MGSGKLERVILMRHGKAKKAGPLMDDGDRPLTLSGRYATLESSPKILEFLGGNSDAHVMTSNMRRSIETARLFCEVAGIEGIKECEGVGNGDMKSVMEEAGILGGSVLIVGHEPYLSQWCEELGLRAGPFGKGDIKLLSVQPDGSFGLQSEMSEEELSGASRIIMENEWEGLGSESYLRDVMLAAGRGRELVSLILGTYEEADEDAIHDLRVVVRRLRVAVAMMKKLFDEDSYGLIAESLESVTRSTTVLRELDVMDGLMESSLMKMSNEGCRDRPTDEAWIEYKSRFVSERRKALSLAMEDIASFHSSRTLELIEECISDIVSTKSAKKIMKAISRRFGKLAGRAAETLSGSMNEPTVMSLHRSRICCKKVRYSLDIFPSLGGWEKYRMMEMASRLQKVLGEAHDVSTSAERAREVTDGIRSMEGIAERIGSMSSGDPDSRTIKVMADLIELLVG